MNRILFLFLAPLILFAAVGEKEEEDQSENQSETPSQNQPAPSVAPVNSSARGPWTIQTRESPQQVEAELTAAESEFNRAKEMFNPWYTGPLLTPSASMMPPGYGNLQPYIFMVGNYAHYDQFRTAQGLPENLYQFTSSNIVQFGITQTMDIIAVPTFIGQFESGFTGGGFADLPITIGFPILTQTLYVPQVKFSIQETFPTGRYQNLNTNGLALSGTGGGSYQTQFSIGACKLILWTYKHPMNIRGYLSYNIPTPVHVRGFNSYGGGFGTHGMVKPGKTITADLGIEWSASQAWVLALDIVYKAQNQTTFKGFPGTIDGAPAVVGTGYNDNLSLAPGFEYNWSENLGIVAGGWFSVYGRNSFAFVQGIFSVCWTFPVVN